VAKLTEKIIKEEYKPFSGSLKSGQKVVKFGGKSYVKKSGTAKKPVSKTVNKTVKKSENKPKNKLVKKLVKKTGVEGKGEKPVKRKSAIEQKLKPGETLTQYFREKYKRTHPGASVYKRHPMDHRGGRKGEGFYANPVLEDTNKSGGKSSAVAPPPKIKGRKIGADFSKTTNYKSGRPNLGAGLSALTKQKALDDFNRLVEMEAKEIAERRKKRTRKNTSPGNRAKGGGMVVANRGGPVDRRKSGMSLKKKPKGSTVARGSGAARTQYFRKV